MPRVFDRFDAYDTIVLKGDHWTCCRQDQKTPFFVGRGDKSVVLLAVLVLDLKKLAALHCSFLT